MNTRTFAPSAQIKRAAAQTRPHERGAAMALSMILLALVGVVSVSVLAVVSHEARIAGSDFQRTQTFYASAAGIEKMTSDFSALYNHTSRPTQGQLDYIASSYPPELLSEHYTLEQSLALDGPRLTAMRQTQGLGNTAFPRVTIPSGPFSGLLASVAPYRLTSTATHVPTSTRVSLERSINNYLIPLFQFGTFSDKDLEFWPQPPMTFNGRVHANGNIYFGGDITFLSKVTTANEAVADVLRNNGTLGYYNDPRWVVNGITVHMTDGSVVGGPNLNQPRADGRGKFPGSPNGTDNTAWKNVSVAAAQANTPNQFGGQLLTKATGAAPLLLPLQLDGKQARELIKRQMPDDSDTLRDSRFDTKAQIRILIDDENAGSGNANVAGIPATKGVYLSTFNPLPLNGGNALRVINDAGGYQSNLGWFQGDPARNRPAETVRSVRNDYYGAILAATTNATTGGANATSTNYTANLTNNAIPKSPNGAVIPTGSGLRGHILIEVVPPLNADGSRPDPIDVTAQILSMGMTVGEPNGIVLLQRPEWASFMQGSRDREGRNMYLTYFHDNSVANRRALADGAISVSVPFNIAGFIDSNDNSLDDDPHTGSTPFLPNAATMSRDDKPPATGLNRIVPINIYNVREGRINETLSATVAYQRGIGSVIDLNMRNLARWVDGVYDSNLLSGSPALSTNIGSADGYVVYVSDRRGDRVKQERNDYNLTIQTTNGLVDNEDVYGYNQANGQTPDPGEDVIDDGFDPATGKLKKASLQIDQCELPSVPTALSPPTVTAPLGVDSTDFSRAVMVADWNPLPPLSVSGCSNPASNQYWFRRGVRLFNGENLQVTGAADRLSTTKGITVATENMVYIWGNYNTTGISSQPVSGSTLNDGGYTGPQVPAAVVADAFFPISKTWYDALPAMYPEGSTQRIADAGTLTDAAAIPIGSETSVRAGIIAGVTLSAMVGTSPPSYYLQWLNGGVHNYPRFLETWSVAGTWDRRWNYVGSYIMLYNSTQAVGPYSVVSSVVYSPPRRNWAFDITFTDPSRLPPGTPQFQYIEPTGFRQSL